MRRFLCSLLVIVTALGCGGDSTGPSSVNGVYTLRTIDGQSMPYTFAQLGSYRLEVTGGAMTFNADNTFSDRVDLRETDGTQVTTDSYTETGTYTQSGAAIALRYSDGTTSSASVSGSTITQIVDGITVVYRK